MKWIWFVFARKGKPFFALAQSWQRSNTSKTGISTQMFDANNGKEIGDLKCHQRDLLLVALLVVRRENFRF